MATFPGAIATFRTMVNRVGVLYDALKTKVIYAEDLNKHSDEINAIETELGTNPKGAYASVKAWLTALAAAVVTKCTGAEINTGTDDAKFATPKAIADSNVAFLADIPTLPVKASGAEITTGTDDAKFLTAKALADATIGKFGAAWSSWSPSYTNITIGNGTVVAKYVQIGKTVHFIWSFVLGSSSAIGSSSMITLPVTPNDSDYLASISPIGQAVFLDIGSAITYSGICRLQSSTEIRGAAFSVSGTLITPSSISATSPFTWVETDKLILTGTYEAA